jgi:hypothetical protein
MLASLGKKEAAGRYYILSLKYEEHAQKGTLIN